MCVAIALKLESQKQAAGWIWCPGCRLLTPDLGALLTDLELLWNPSKETGRQVLTFHIL